MATFENYDPSKPMVPGEQYRITIRIPTKYQNWFRTAITDAIKLADYAEDRYSVNTVEFLHPTNVTNPDYFYVRITFTRTYAGTTDASRAEVLSGQQILYIVGGIVFSAIAVTVLLDHFEHAVTKIGGTVANVLSPAVIIGVIVVLFIVMKGRG